VDFSSKTGVRRKNANAIGNNGHKSGIYEKNEKYEIWTRTKKCRRLKAPAEKKKNRDEKKDGHTFRTRKRHDGGTIRARRKEENKKLGHRSNREKYPRKQVRNGGKLLQEWGRTPGVGDTRWKINDLGLNSLCQPTYYREKRRK